MVPDESCAGLEGDARPDWIQGASQQIRARLGHVSASGDDALKLRAAVAALRWVRRFENRRLSPHDVLAVLLVSEEAERLIAHVRHAHDEPSSGGRVDL